MTDRQEVTLKVVGDRTIHCGGCENTVQVSLSRIPGVEQVQADRNSQLIQFELSPGKAELALVKAELETIGYEVELA
jgi:copper chaperone CopZ